MADEDFYQDQDAGPLNEALSSRRIPHSRSRKTRPGGGKGRNGASGAPFNPLRLLGRYEVQIGSSGKKSRSQEDSPESWLEVHQLTSNEDGFLGTFDFATKAAGILVLAGSRKGLASIVRDLEQEEDEQGTTARGESTNDPGEGTDGENQYQDPDTSQPSAEPSAMEIEDEKINRRARAFEKNTFRNPKFWMRWKAHVQPQSERSQNDTASLSESNSSYLVFSSNDCDKFEGTVTVDTLNWDNMKIVGRKIHSKPTTCPVEWSDFD